MGKTSIEWTDFSINPIRARHKLTGAVGHYCEKISQGCKNCYASRLQSRFRMPAFNEQRGDDNIEVLLDGSKLVEVLRRNKPTRYFWCDMTDIFGDWVPDEYIDRCFTTMALTPHHTHQVLTKRPERMQEYIVGLYKRRGDFIDRATHNGAQVLITSFENWLPQVWLGVSVENQETADKRIPLLLETPAAVRFLSCEPLLGKINWRRSVCKCPWFEDAENTRHLMMCPLFEPARDLGLHWVIVGGESGPGARPMHPGWALGLLDQCETAGVSYFFKQWGEFYPEHPVTSNAGFWQKAKGWVAVNPDGSCLEYGSDYKQEQFKAGAWWMAKVGKKAAGRMLGGREWSQFPKINQ